MSNILEKIVADKRDEVALRKENVPVESFKQEITVSTRDFYAALAKPTTSFILECKKASPSKGLIRDVFDLTEITGVYKNYADCVSVLTDEKYFQGHFDYVKQVRQLLDQPIICKDFFIDEYQVYLARYCGADAILLMLSVLNDEEYKALAALAHSLHMDVLTEVSNEEEVHRAIALDAKIFGINNRDLRDLSTDLNTTYRLEALIPKGSVVISESGIYNHRQVKELSRVASGFLVGSSLMAQANLDMACRKLVYGENKVCGLTRVDDAQAAYDAGAVYGGLIFYPKSPRYVDLDCAKSIAQSVALNFVGVFVNEQVARVADIAKQLELSAVQLHGSEDSEYINKLASLLPQDCVIFKACAVKDTIPEMDNALISKYILDTFNKESAHNKTAVHGGTGEQFDWQLLKDTAIDDAFLIAGGINPDNTRQALAYNALGLDINSGVEISPGKKSKEKIEQVFEQIKQY